ncbi:hypothetical protein [Halosimplex pelagicum]|uniref:Uncharacterized protein n=1 Tax=Halosimplex pelagicum TaxID=869886 RepID=A0A7D5P9X8_9EURY|nr:hypothetical protein [Halosimplex pelagicum]QLH82428.1 hypothetical protein HZS54_12735 [Halosimplex pelagicum]QLH82484.1 hypothetical protein HZS54_13040 [Halosimplex pelagicum]
MSQTEQRVREFVPGETDIDQWIRDHRDLIEREANSDAPDAWVFQSFLDSIDEDDDDESTGSDEGGDSA